MQDVLVATSSARGGTSSAVALQRQLVRSHEVQRANLLVRLRAERALASATKLMMVVGAEGLLRGR